MVVSLPCVYEALSLTLNTTKRKKEGRERRRGGEREEGKGREWKEGRKEGGEKE